MSLRFFLEQPSYLRGVIAAYLQEAIPKTIWLKLSVAPKRYIFQAAVLGLVVIALILRSGATMVTLLAIAFGIFIAWFWFNGEFTEYDSEQKIKKNTLRRLERTMQRKRNIFDQSARSLLQKNPALVKVFSSLYVFARFDRRNYREALIHANQLVRIYESIKIGVVLPYQMLDISEELSRNCLNAVQSMVHSLPSTSVGDYRFQVSIKALQHVLQKICDDIKLVAESQYEELGPDIHTPPPSTRAGPWPDPTEEKNYNVNYSFYY